MSNDAPERVWILVDDLPKVRLPDPYEDRDYVTLVPESVHTAAQQRIRELEEALAVIQGET